MRCDYPREYFNSDFRCYLDLGHHGPHEYKPREQMVNSDDESNSIRKEELARHRNREWGNIQVHRGSGTVSFNCRCIDGKKELTDKLCDKCAIAVAYLFKRILDMPFSM